MNDRRVFRIIMSISALVVFIVIVLNRKLIPAPEVPPYFIRYQPLLHACLNGTCFILLLFSFLAIKRGNIPLHKRLNLTAFLVSSVFLISYVIYHYFAGDAAFPREDPMRPFYLFILISHISLSVIVFPMVLYSFYLGLKDERIKHRKLSRWTLPLWLYVTLTGVLVYFMMAPHYHFA